LAFFLGNTQMPSVEIPPHADTQIESVDTVWKGRFPLQVVKFRHRRFDGAMSGLRTWELWRRGNAAAVLPYDPVSDSVVVIEQFRLPAQAAGLSPVLVELAAGLAGEDEPPEQVIRREAHEEMGLHVARLEKIGDFLLTPGGCDENCSLYAGEVRLTEVPANGLLGTHGLDSEHEDIRVRVLPASVAIERAVAGRYPNSVAAIGLLWLGHRREWLRTLWSSP
jgi:ADP-ribose pyrophosphatase